MISADGIGETRLTKAPESESQPGWSADGKEIWFTVFPDGKRLAFQSDRTGRMELWVMNADGTGARQITK